MVQQHSRPSKLNSGSLVLLPQPRSIMMRSGALTLSGIRQIVVDAASAESSRIAQRLRSEAGKLVKSDWSVRTGIVAKTYAGSVVLDINPGSVLNPQGYRLSLNADHILLTAHDAQGLFYGIMTLIQILRQAEGALPLLDIEDDPDFPVRGVMLDISRDKVPTMETLFALVDRLAEWKINHLELYTEHTFAYSQHRDVWMNASPMTAGEIRELDVYCRSRYVDLAPNQNSFGHMGRWLKLPRYHDLAECPDGYEVPWGGRRSEPNSLNPVDPRSLELMAELYGELLPNFSSRKFNVGCDETWDLGQGKCRELCEKRGKGRVYLDFLLKLYEQVNRQGRTMHFWGDIIIHHPELVSELPRDVVVLEWGYEANHPFDEHGAQFAASGLPFYVCPGTSSWNSLAGRTDNCLANLRNAAENGLKHGAVGFLNTDWGDNGHVQYLPASYLGFAAGAALAWCLDTNKDACWQSVLNVQVFKDQAAVMGGLAYDLGNAYRKSGHETSNASDLFWLLIGKPGWDIPPGMTKKTLLATKDWIDSAMSPLPEARLMEDQAGPVLDEFRNTARMLKHACDRGLLIRRGETETQGHGAKLIRDRNAILEQHRSLWMARNRPGGLVDSVGFLEQRP